MSRPRRAAAAVLVAVLAGTLAAAAQTPQKKLKSVEQQLEQTRQRQSELDQQSQSLGAELEALRAQEVAAATQAQAHETALTRLEAQLAGLNAAEKAKAAELDRNRGGEARLLLALVRIAREPPAALALGPAPPVDTLRGGILIGRAIPPLEDRAHDLAGDIARLETLRAGISAAEAQHRAEREGLAQDRTRIAALIARKQDLQHQTRQQLDDAARRQKDLAARAGDLKDLIARLDAPPAKGPALPVTAGVPDPSRPGNIRAISQAKGRMAVPASGLLVARFGDPEAAGPSKGLTFETRPGAQVVAPFDGKVVYAGPFKGYGQILIIGHGDGYYSLLAGLDRVDQSAGQWLVAGEPVGVMAQGARPPRLYLELRFNGQSINPLPWLAIRDEKVN